MAFKNYIKYWKDAQRYVLSKILFFLLFSFSFLLSEKNRDQDSKLCICFFRILKPAYANPGYAVVTQSNSHHPIKNPNPVSESKSHLSRILHHSALQSKPPSATNSARNAYPQRIPIVPQPIQRRNHYPQGTEIPKPNIKLSLCFFFSFSQLFSSFFSYLHNGRA